MHLGPVVAALARPSTYSGILKESLAILGHTAAYPLSVVDSHLTRVEGVDPSPDVPPVVLVHGYGARPIHWLVPYRALAAAGVGEVSRIQYDAWSSDIPELSARLVDHVEEIASRTGHERVHLVGHSLGGVVMRHAIEVLGLAPVVDTAITVGSPHGGTPWADLARFGPRHEALRTISQLRTGSPLLRRIEQAARRNVGAHDVRWVAFYANTDWVVPARSAQIRTEGAENVLMRDEGHLSPLLSREVASEVASRLAATPADLAVEDPAA